MKHKSIIKALSLLLCLVLLISCVPLTALAAESELNMTEGDVITGFVPSGTACTTTDASVAWVDDNGNLNALKPGTVTVSDGQTETTVTVADYADGSEVVGNLELYVDGMAGILSVFDLSLGERGLAFGTPVNRL